MSPKTQDWSFYLVMTCFPTTSRSMMLTRSLPKTSARGFLNPSGSTSAHEQTFCVETTPFLSRATDWYAQGCGLKCPAYTFLLLADISRSYAATVDIEPGSSFQYLFEKVVEAAGVGQDAGAACGLDGRA